MTTSATDRVTLSSDELAVEVTPARGADIAAVVDRRSGTNLLFVTPWGGGAAAAGWDSQSRWLGGYAGGWQVLCPNAGPERHADGATLGFHGETAIVAWDVLDVGPAAVTCSVSLVTAPLRLTRTISVTGRSVVVDETVENESRDECRLIWTHHPAFGLPLLGAGSRLDLPGGVVVPDPAEPGPALAPNGEHRWPHTRAADGSTLDLRDIPPPGQPRALLASVQDLPEGWFAIGNPRLGLGAAMCWDLTVFPYVWLWQELDASPGFPWFRRARAMAVEPANILTDQRRADGSAPPKLAGGARIETRLELTVFDAAGPVTSVRPGGVVEQAAAAQGAAEQTRGE
jgi:hypothetical protein